MNANRHGYTKDELAAWGAPFEPYLTKIGSGMAWACLCRIDGRLRLLWSAPVSLEAS